MQLHGYSQYSTKRFGGAIGTTIMCSSHGSQSGEDAKAVFFFKAFMLTTSPTNRIFEFKIMKTSLSRKKLKLKKLKNKKQYKN